MRPDRLGLAALALAAAVFVARPALAYPQYIAKGAAQCDGCHYSPTGGGITTSMGQGSVEALVPDLLRIGVVSRLRGAIARPEVTGRDEADAPALQADLGVDARVLFLQSRDEVDASTRLLTIPMLAEAGGVLAYGPFFAYATATVRKRSTDQGAQTAFSREHWLSLQLNDEHRLRAGRMVLPFGLRMPDHTLYTREDLGFNKYQQSYAVAWDHVGEALELHVAAFAGDLWLAPPALQERGGAITVAHAFFDDRLSLGASALFGATRFTLRPAASVFVRASPFERTYVLAEAAGQRRQHRDTGQAQLHGAGFVRLGWFPHESTDLFVEVAGRAIEGGDELLKLRYQVGLNSHLLPWVELSPAFLLEEDVETGLKATAMGQLHLVY